MQQKEVRCIFFFLTYQIESDTQIRMVFPIWQWAFDLTVNDGTFFLREMWLSAVSQYLEYAAYGTSHQAFTRAKLLQILVGLPALPMIGEVQRHYRAGLTERVAYRNVYSLQRVQKASFWHDIFLILAGWSAEELVFFVFVFFKVFVCIGFLFNTASHCVLSWCRRLTVAAPC